ncbi:hypothetical protein Lal_00031868 [Lupinus albus]|nr:hypothetical protein Lal_00031868 [Lupinus albus]
MDIKGKKAYIVWNVSKEEATSSTSNDDESAKLCLMTQITILVKQASKATQARLVFPIPIMTPMIPPHMMLYMELMLNYMKNLKS